MFNKKIFGVALSLGLFFSTPLAISAKKATNVKTTNVNVVEEKNIEKKLYKTLNELVEIFVNDKKVKGIVKEIINKDKKDVIKSFPKALKNLEPNVKKKLKELENYFKNFEKIKKNKEFKNKNDLKRKIETLKNVLDFIDLYKKNSKFKKEVEAYIKKVDMNKVYEKLYSSNLKARNKKI